jgi:hypothetical protein
MFTSSDELTALLLEHMQKILLAVLGGKHASAATITDKF